jgi:taurine dioxygenase
MATTGNWIITPITGSSERGTFGAELSGGTLSDDADVAALADLLAEHLVLVMRGQQLDHAGQVALARALGEPTPAHPVVPGHPDHPEILELDGAQGGRNARWHTDVTFVPEPPTASVLVADLTPPSGGDTLWADMRTAYTMLSPAIAALIDDLEAVHRISPLAYWGEPFDTALSREDAAELFERSRNVPPVVHPVVRVHPETGRPALFVNPGFTSHVVGMSRIESEHLLQMLYAHATQPEFVLRHRWQTGDVVIWDNRATMHYAADDYGTAERRMRRVTIRGGRPFSRSGAESRIVDDPLLAVR